MYVYGSYSFEPVGKGFVAFRIHTKDQQTLSFLKELKLVKPASKHNGRLFVWIDEFKEFLTTHGYHSDSITIWEMRHNGLVMRSDYAITFRLQFL